MCVCVNVFGCRVVCISASVGLCISLGVIDRLPCAGHLELTNFVLLESIIAQSGCEPFRPELFPGEQVAHRECTRTHAHTHARTHTPSLSHARSATIVFPLPVSVCVLPPDPREPTCARASEVRPCVVGRCFLKADLGNNERHYRIANKFWNEHGRKIYDATEGGKCDIFEKVDWKTALYPK